MNDDRERDAKIAEHLFGWQRVTSYLTPNHPLGYLLLAPDAERPDEYRPSPSDAVRPPDFWYLMDSRIPHYSTDVGLTWRMLARIVPRERPFPSPDTGSMIVHPITPERWHSVSLSTGSSTVFMDWHLTIRTLDEARAIVGGVGPNLPRIVAESISRLIDQERWVGGRRTDVCGECSRLMGPSRCRLNPPHEVTPS